MMFTRVIVLLMLALAMTSAAAKVRANSRTADAGARQGGVEAASCRVGVTYKASCSAQGCRYETQWGSGTLIHTDVRADGGREGLVLSCAHVFFHDDGTPITDCTIEVQLGGRSYVGRKATHDRAADLSAIVIDAPEAAPVKLALGPLEPTTPVETCGFGSGQFARLAARLAAWEPEVNGFEHFRIDRPARQGDSGGGAFVATKLVGVVVATDGHSAVITSGGPLRRFLQRILGPRLEVALGDAKPPAGEDRTAEADPRLAAIEEQIRALGAKLEGGQSPAADARTAEAEARQAARDQSMWEKIAALAKGAAAKGAPVAVQAAAKAGLLDGIGLGGLALLGAGPLGLGALLTLGIVKWRVKRRLKKRRIAKARTAEAGPRPGGGGGDAPARERTVRFDAPPPPQQRVPETHFVPYETDAYALAHQWAREQLYTRYPAHREYVSAEKSLIDQYLAARK